jgi:pimeloyl-ACP methyl ester carboxylesterase
VPGPIGSPVRTGGWAGPPGAAGRTTGTAADDDASTKRWLVAILVASLVLGVIAIAGFGGGSGPGGSPGGNPGQNGTGAGREATCDLADPWTCATVRVPAQRLPAGPSPEQIDVLYAVHPADAPASGSGRRVLVLVAGGPGASGIGDADWMAHLLDPRIQRAFDIVAFDARGTGGTDPRECPSAGSRYGVAAITATTAEAFAAQCTAEAGVAPDELGRYSSREIAEDIDAIRAALGVARVTVYGSSYGTVIAQAYAAAHPDRLDGMVLDAPIDRSIPAAELWATAATGFRTALDMTVEACAEDADCADALPDPERVINRVYQQLAPGDTLTQEVTGPDGKAYEASMDRADFQAVLESAMYDESLRVSLLRALQAVDRGDRRLLLRLVDVEGGAGHAASFAYFATWCADVRASPSSRVDDFEAFTRVARDAGLNSDWQDLAWALAPCLYWPGQPQTWRPPVESSAVPILILASTADPITPVSEARSILARHAEARLVETQGGAHGSMGEPCPNERVADFVVTGRLPAGVTSICEGSVIDGYVPIAPSPALTAEDAALGMVWELLGAPEFAAWDGEDPLRLGCADAGTARLVLPKDDDRVAVTLDGCTWATNGAFDGTGWIDAYTWDSDLDLSSPRGSLRLVTRGTSWTLTGTWDGKAVDLRE